MSASFAAKLEFALKALSMSRGRLAREVGVDKSVVGRWARGAGMPSADNLARLAAVIAVHAPGFTLLDWEKELDALGAALGRPPASAPGWRLPPGPQGAVLDMVLATTARRGEAYEGFFRSTRPYATHPGRFIHDQMMVRRDDHGLLRFDLRSDRVRVEGWVLPQHHQLFIIGAESASASLAFGIFNGVNTMRAEVVDGLLLSCALDAGRTPTACAVVFERVGDLSGDLAADEARLAELAKGAALAPEGSVAADLAAHLTRDIGPEQLARRRRLAAAPAARALPRAGSGGRLNAAGAAFCLPAPAFAPSRSGPEVDTRQDPRRRRRVGEHAMARRS